MVRKGTGGGSGRNRRSEGSDRRSGTGLGLNTSTGGNANQNDFEEEFHEDVGTQIIDDIYMPPPPVHPNLTGDQTGKRLIIENIKITNFKSYGGTTLLGPFHKSFNSIVGPNGSGKSNVIDSMLFVFGYRAQKLRSNKLSTLIHNSDTMPNCDFAKVSVNFAMLNDKGGLDHEIVKNSSFSISRVVEKNNSMYYLIDSSRVTFREVSKKLQDYGIDLRYNRFLILQGEVEQISLMKPKAENPNDTGMLEYLEDIVGTSRYKDPIERLNFKTAELNKEKTTFVNRVNLSKKEMGAISDAKDEALQALILENKKKIERSKIYQLNLHKLSGQLQQYEADYSVEKEKMDTMDKALAEVEAKKFQLDSEEKTKSIEYKQLKEEQTNLKEKFNECNQQDYYLNTKNKATKDKLKKLRKQIEEDDKKLEDLREKAQESQDNTEIEQLERKRTEVDEELKKNEEEMKTETETVQQECSQLIKERDELDKALMQFKSEQSDKLNAMNEAHNAVTILKEQGAQAKAKYEQLNSKLTKVQEETVEKEAAIKRYEREIPEQENKHADMDGKRKTLEGRHTELTERLHQKNEELQMLKRDANKAQSRDQLSNAIKAEMAKGRLHGVYGRLGDLGAIDKKYDVAVTTACPRLNNFVVDTMENGAEVLKFVKANRLPSITLIALDKLHPWTHNYQTNKQFPEGVPRLFDLIKVNDERFLPAFYFSLSGDTLVTNDMQQASRIGYGQTRYRCVTLGGGMVETNGSLSGGGRPRSGGMGSSIAVDQIDHGQISTLEQEVETMRNEREQLTYQIDSLRKDFNNLERDLKFMQEKLGTFRLEVVENVKRVDQFRENLQIAKAEMEKFEANPEIEKAETEYQKRKKIYEKEEAKMEKQQDELNKYDEEIQEKLNSKLEPIKKQKKSLEKKLKELQAKLKQIHSERKTIELNLTKAEESLTANNTQKAELEQELEKIGADITKLEVEAKETTDLYEEANNKCAKFEGEFIVIQDQVKELDEQVKKIKSKKLDLKHEIDKKFKVLHEKRQRAGAYKAELESLVLDKVDDLNEDDENEGTDSEDDEEEEEEEEEETENEKKRPENGEALNGDSMEVDGESQQPPTEPMETDEAPESQVVESGELPKKSSKKDKKKKKNRHPQIPKLTPEECEELNHHEVERKIEQIDSELKKLSPNFAAIEQFRVKRAEHKQKLKELREVEEKKATYQQCLNGCKAKRLEEFRIGFFAISRKLKELYRTITLGGDADLEFIDSLDPFSEGINFAVRPNKKSWKNNINLSGGEKTLASLALIFALHYYKPSPLYIMDEIDAALDFKNVSIVANYIKQRTRNTQFLIISLRNNMYELAEMLIGVYKTFNVSKTVAFDPIAFEDRCSQEKTAASKGLCSSLYPMSQMSSQPLSQMALGSTFGSQPVTTTNGTIMTNGNMASAAVPEFDLHQFDTLPGGSKSVTGEEQQATTAQLEPPLTTSIVPATEVSITSP